jgi:hypothetical protein
VDGVTEQIESADLQDGSESRKDETGQRGSTWGSRLGIHVSELVGPVERE